MILKNPKHVAKTLEALGIDTIDGDYDFDGTMLSVKGKTDTDIQAAEASLNTAALDAEDALQERNTKRAAEYPSIGDQLDAIWKQLGYLRLKGGIDLIQDADDMLGEILAVKKKYKK